MGHSSFFEQGLNCWKSDTAEKTTFLVDGETYFLAIAEAFESAEKVIYIIGWDIDSRIRLRREEQDDNLTLDTYIDQLAKNKPGLHIYLLEWDFAMLYSLERETWPLLKFGWKTHERVHFELDDRHPVGASHHQKIIVVDDCLAFVGGFDLAICRWDTRDHLKHNPKRQDDSVTYGPFHDVQMMVYGPVARHLGALARDRWEQATGETLSSVSLKNTGKYWPTRLKPAFENHTVAILRTLPEYEEQAETREIENFYLEAINRAESSIYIENQYFTSHRIGDALKQKLTSKDGPEIIIVLPKSCSGWLEKETMGTMRERLLKILYEADTFERLKVYFPTHQEFDDEIINVHSKLMVVDDRLLTVGSANLNNRSMGFDTECNLAISADDDPSIRSAIIHFRDQLIAEHLDVKVDDFSQTVRETASLLESIKRLNQQKRFLCELQPDMVQSASRLLSAKEIVDPERPIRMEGLLELFEIGPERKEKNSKIKNKGWRFTLIIIAAIVLAISWRWSPMNEWLDIDKLLAISESIRNNSMTIPIVLLIYIVGSSIMFPITVMILATALSFGPFMGFFLALSGSLLGGFFSYCLGRWLGRDVVRHLAGDKLNQVSRKIARRGWIAIAVLRIVPLAPFTIVNMVAGSSHISVRSFLIGTAIGMGPGIMAIMIFEGGLEQVLRNPGWDTFVLASITFLLALLVLLFGKHWLKKQGDGDGK